MVMRITVVQSVWLATVFAMVSEFISPVSFMYARRESNSHEQAHTDLNRARLPFRHSRWGSEVCSGMYICRLRRHPRPYGYPLGARGARYLTPRSENVIRGRVRGPRPGPVARMAQEPGGCLPCQETPPAGDFVPGAVACVADIVGVFFFTLPAGHCQFSFSRARHPQLGCVSCLVGWVPCGADDGNRTRVSSLGSWNSTIELRPQGTSLTAGTRLATFYRYRVEGPWNSQDQGANGLFLCGGPATSTILCRAAGGVRTRDPHLGKVMLYH